MKACIVVPTIRPDSIATFLAAWEGEFRDHRVIVVEDNPTRTFSLPEWVEHVSWEQIDSDLGADSWIIPRRSGAIRNYGIMLAGRQPADMIVMLDDDCLPNGDAGLLLHHWYALEAAGTEAPLLDTIGSLFSFPSPIRARGFPKGARRCRTVVNHGLWNGVPDLDGETQLKLDEWRVHFSDHSVQVPIGVMFPMSAMNVAFRPEVLEAMYQVPMGEKEPFHRFDDIWCGWIMKKACDAMRLSVRSGSPCITHVRASDAARNAELEAPGIIENERVWRAILAMEVAEHSLSRCLESIHDGLKGLGSYWVKVAAAAQIWRRRVSGGMLWNRLPS